MVGKGGLPAPAEVCSPEPAVAEYVVGTGRGALYSARITSVGSELRHFKKPTKIEIFGNGELPMQEPWSPVQKLWNPMQNAIDSYANGYGFLCKRLWIPMQNAMDS